MPSIIEQAPESKTTTLPPDDDTLHGVCACQIDSVPRLALCGTDCTDALEGDGGEMCVVCVDAIVRREPCRVCGGLD